jgi:DNA-binding transcriptional regulator YbjK
VSAALELFARDGFAATPVRPIAAEPGVAQGLLYNDFDGKDALLRSSSSAARRTCSAASGEVSAGRGGRFPRCALRPRLGRWRETG